MPMAINSKLIPPTSCLLMFEATARLGSVTKAATELYVSPTAVSKQIKKLEEFLSAELLVRTTKGVFLTEKGRNYLVYVEQALNTLAEATSQMNTSHTPPALNVEVGPCFLHYWLLPRLDDFRQQHPSILLNLNVNNERSVGTENQYDVAFFYSKVDSQNMNNYLLFPERVMLVCSPSFFKKHNGRIDCNEPFKYSLIMIKDELPFWVGWKIWAEKVGIKYHIPPHTLFVDDQVAVLQAAINDAGIALAWDWQVKDLIDSNQLIALTDSVEFEDKAYFLSIAENCSNPAAKAFTDWVIKQG